MKATSIEQIREHLARGGRVMCHVREFPGIEAHCRSVVRSRTSGDGFVFDDGTWAQFDNSFVDHWELLPIEEEEVDDDSYLKPCPFCGGDADSMTYCGNDTVFCETCPAMMGGEESKATREELAEAWNRRPSEEKPLPGTDSRTLPIVTEDPTGEHKCNKCHGRGEFCDQWPGGIFSVCDKCNGSGNATKQQIAGEELHQRIRQSLLFGHYPAMNDLRDWWQATTGERIEWGRRCEKCECTGSITQICKSGPHQISAMTVPCSCDRGYTVRPTWMGEKATGAQEANQ